MNQEKIKLISDLVNIRSFILIKSNDLKINKDTFKTYLKYLEKIDNEINNELEVLFKE